MYKIALICFARRGSSRLPQKNMLEFCGIPLLQYTLDTMKQFPGNKCYLLTDFAEAALLAEHNDIKVIWRDHPKEFDDIRLNEWAHEQIGADAYILLQPTSPIRDRLLITKWMGICWNTGVDSAFSVYPIDRNNYTANGSFYYYTKEQLKTRKIVDQNSLLFIDKYNIDIDTQEEFDAAEQMVRKL